MVSIIICSVSPHLLKDLQQNIAQTIGVEYEIIAIDNRARQIGEDTGLPVLEREDGYLHKLADWVNYPVKTEINLPWTSIDKWKKQFY